MEGKTELERFITASGEYEEKNSDENEYNDANEASEDNTEGAAETGNDETTENNTYSDDSEPAFPKDDDYSEIEPVASADEENVFTDNGDSSEFQSTSLIAEPDEPANIQEPGKTVSSRSETANYPDASPRYIINTKPSGSAIGLGIVNLIIASLTLCVVTAGFFLCSDYIKSFKAESEEKQKQIEKLEEEKNILESDYIEAMSIINNSEPEPPPPAVGDSVESGKILLYDTDIGYIWVPVLSVLPQNTYRKAGFSVDERGRMSYVDNGEESSYFGIDVSSHQGDINWQLVKEDGVEFAFLRIGYRGYGEEGNLRSDEKFVQNYDGAHDAGIDLGVYFFSQAISPEEAVEEAKFLLEELDGRTLEYPIVYDWESVLTPEDETARTDDVMPQTLTLCAIAFCETIEDAGYDAMIYTNKKTAVMKYDMRRLSEYPVWLAYYDTTLNYCYDFDIWQYGTGIVDGIEGEVDINIAMIK